MKHILPSEFRRRVVTVDLVGVGGTGSMLLTRLARLHVALTASGHPGLHVTAWDPDRVSAANIGRTTFAPSDVGRPKASVLLTRVNLAHGLHWRGLPERYAVDGWNTERLGRAADLVVTCTDSLRSRVELHRAMYAGGLPPPRYWLDCGNDADTGQVILGEPEWLLDSPAIDEGPRRKRLPTVIDLFPDMEARAENEEEQPESCSLMTALDSQSLLINDHMATWAAELLWRLFRDGGLEYHGVYVSARTGRVNPILVDPPSPEQLARQAAALVNGAALAEV